MADRTGPRAPRDRRGPSRDPRNTHHRESRRNRPAIEPLEERMLLALTMSSTNPVPISPHPIGPPTQKQLGVAYHQVEAIQVATLKALGTEYRRVGAAATQFGARANHALARDQCILQLGANMASRQEQGLDVARGIEDQTASTDKIYIPNGLFTTLQELVVEARTTGSQLTRSARRSTDTVVHKLDALAAHLDHSAARRP